MTRPEPLILTVGLDARSFARLDAERRRHFPPERNLLDAHLTMFHALPGEAEAGIRARLALAAAACPPLRLRVAGLRSLGRGVAYRIESPPLVALRAALARDFEPLLGAQDRQGWRPHVTVQNKVDPARARATLAGLEAGFAPWDATGESLRLWRYLGGPWEAVAEFPFPGAGG